VVETLMNRFFLVTGSRCSGAAGVGDAQQILEVIQILHRDSRRVKAGLKSSPPYANRHPCALPPLLPRSSWRLGVPGVPVLPLQPLLAAGVTTTRRGSQQS